MRTKKRQVKKASNRKTITATARRRRKTRDRAENTLYTYVAPTNRKHAMTVGKKKWKTVSKYINALIARDRGLKAKTPKARSA